MKDYGSHHGVAGPWGFVLCFQHEVHGSAPPEREDTRAAAKGECCTHGIFGREEKASTSPKLCETLGKHSVITGEKSQLVIIAIKSHVPADYRNLWISKVITSGHWGAGCHVQVF